MIIFRGSSTGIASLELETSENASPETKNPAVIEAFKSVAELTDEERLSVFACFCQSCGCAQPAEGMQCQCWNDE